MRITVFVTPEMHKELRAIRKALNVDPPSLSLAETYSNVLNQGIKNVVAGFYCADDIETQEAYEAAIKEAGL